MLQSLFAYVWRLRCILLCYLLSYTRWMYQPKSIKTKIWALAVKLISGSRNHGVQGYVDAMPSLPLPDLRTTVDKYLVSVQPLLSEEQFATTKEVANRFLKGEGPDLQRRLEMLRCQGRNWLEDIWLNIAYLRGRGRVAVYSNVYCVGQRTIPTPSRKNRASALTHASLEFMHLYQQNKLPCFKTMGMVPMCNSGYKFAFGTHRVPGKGQDSLRNTSDPQHVVIMCNGQYYKASAYAEDGSLVTAHEWLERFTYIEDQSAGEDGTEVAALTAQDRDTWGAQYSRLRESAVNSATLDDIETSAFIVVLDDSKPETLDEVGRCFMQGNGGNRFFDKTYSLIVCANGEVGTNIEHAPTDATIWARIWEYCLHHEHYTKDGELVPSDKKLRRLPGVIKLPWELADFNDEIQEAKQGNLSFFATLDNSIKETPFGKGAMKKLRVSPDGFTQMVFQLAYYRVHQKFSLTYESASTRMFHHGRTETIRPVSMESVDFCKAMDDPSVERKVVASHLRKAIRVQTNRKLDAVAGVGVDRHLVGLYAVSMQDSSTPPEFFRDPAWSSLKWDLSTSQTPTKLADFWKLEKCCLGGGFGPVSSTGYGISYVFNGEDTLFIFVSSWKTCPETDSEKLFNQIALSMKDMKTLLETY